MSTKSASKLLQYNRDLYKQKGPINAEADKAFGTWSYANMYDALYNKFSQNKNFNLDMWQQAFKLGEQDQYLTLLEQNRDTELSTQFYDPQYYDYETMMLELYKPMADATNGEEQFQTIYDPVSGEQIEESLGEMSDQAYIQYQIDQMRMSQAAEITRALEQERKDELGWWKQFGGDVVATMGEFGEGLLSGLAGMADFFVGIGYATGYSGAALLTGDKENQNWLDAFVDYFGDKGLTAAEKRTVRAALDEYERTHTHFKDIDGNMTNIGKYVAGISNSIGMMIPAIITNAVTGGAALVGTATFYTSIFSSNVYENATSIDRVNSPSGIKILNATLKTGAEALIEYGLGKLLGGTIQNQMIGMRGRNINKSLINGFSKTSGLKYFLKSAGQEGFEEFLQDFGTECIDQFTALQYEGYGNTGVTFLTLLDSFFVGALSSMLMSGGHVALNATTSAVRNKIVPGSGDILIETAEGPQKVTGLNRLQYSQILSDFQQAVDDLKNGKISPEKNVKLAQEVYGAISAISQFYSSFDQQRIKNCEMLLDRVVKAEKAQVKTEVKSFAETVESTFRSMVDEVGLRHAKKLREAAERTRTVLEEGGVTEVREFIDADGNELKDGDLQELAERLGNNATTIIDELRKAYDWIIVTDGYASAETEGHIFVPESWLKNYNISEIYKYLEQTRVLEALTTDKRLQPMVNRLVTFDKEFTGQENVSKERALMDFLFNKSVYQAFVLTNTGKNAHEYKNFIFQLHETIKSLAESSKHHQQLFRGKQSQIRINLLNKIYEQIKETMREPTIKAIINWGFDPQVIGADSVLTPKDKKLLNQYAQHKRTLANTNKTDANRSAHRNLADDIIKDGLFRTNEKEFLERSLQDGAPIEDRLQAIAMLDEADLRMVTYDFELTYFRTQMQRFADIEHKLVDMMLVEGGEQEYYKESYEYVRSQLFYLQDLVEQGEVSISLSEKISDHLADMAKVFGGFSPIQDLIKDIQWYVDEAIADLPGHTDSRNLGTEDGLTIRAVDRIKETFIEYGYEENDSLLGDEINFILENLGDDGSLSTLQDDIKQLSSLLSDLNKEFSPAELAGITQENKKLFKQVADELEADSLLMRQTGRGAFTIPYHAINHATADDVHKAQFVSDKMDEFKKRYGISARQMIMGDLTGMSMAQRNLLTEDMEVLGVEDNYVNFVIRKLENLLGYNYVVTPLYRQLGKNTSDAGDFQITSNPDFSLRGPDHARLTERLENGYDAVQRWFEKAKKSIKRIKNEDTAYRLVEDFYDAAYEIQAHQYSDFLDFLPGNAEIFWQNLGKMWRNDGAINALQHIIASEDTVKRLFDETDRNISNASLDEYERDHKNTYIYDFDIAEKIPAEQLLSKELLDEDRNTRNAVVRSIALDIGMTAQEESKIREVLDDVITSNEILELIEEIGDDASFAYIKHISDNLSDIVYQLRADYAQKGIIIDPLTGEILGEGYLLNMDSNGNTSARGRILLAMLQSLDNVWPNNTLDKFIDVSQFSPKIARQLSKITVMLRGAGPGAAGYWSSPENTIVIDPDKSSDYVETLVHETNHVLQDKLNLPGGFNSQTASTMPELLQYVLKHYPLYVEYTFRRNGYVFDPSLNLADLSAPMRNILAHCTYMLVQGEVWARAYSHNKSVHGFVEMATPNGVYLLAPDGKTRFKVPYGARTELSMSSPKTSPALAGSALDVSIQRLFELKAEQEAYGYTNSSYTYHSYLTKYDSHTLMAGILDPSIGVIQRTFVKLTDAIKNPQQYLAPEILAKCNGDFSEGNVYYRLREYVEEKFAGVSIDRKESFTDNYVWVDDNSFDDLLVSSIAGKVDDDDATIVTKYELGEKIPLNKFYKAKELAKLGIHPNAFVIISPTVQTETRFDKQHQIGAIYIRANKTVSDYVLIDKLNHEFRHLLQYYNGFETGFTPDFKVTREMIADVKAHVPEVFKNNMIVKWAKTRYGKDWETGIVQHIIYYSVGGEMNAYAWNTKGLNLKPTFVTQEAGNPTIFMPWYDAKTGEGRYKTEFLAMRAEDTSTSEKVLKRTGKEGLDLPMVDKAQKKDPRPRHFSKKKAENTNLKYYTIEGIDQLDPRIQDFVIATTGYEDKLPKALWNSIRKGKLTMQNFYVWFQKAKDIDDFTFNLINKHIFKNDYITSMEELNEILSIDPAIYWATAQVLRKRGLPLDWLVKENDVDKFMEFMKSLEGAKWYDKILDMTEKFTLFQTDVNEKGEPIYENIAADDNVVGQMRALTMHFFDGTLAGAFYVGNTFKQTIYWNEMETRSKIDSADKTLGDGMSDDKDVSLIDAISNEDGALDENSRAVGNDIMALYEIDSNDASMYIDRLVAAAYSQKVDELIERLDLPEKSKIMLRQRLSDPDKLRKNFATLSKKENLTDAEKKQLKNFKFELAKYKEIMTSLTEFKEKLETLIPAEIIIRGTALVVAQMNNKTVDKKIFDLDTEYLKSFSEAAQREVDVQEINDAIQDELTQKDEKLSTKRNHIQRRIKSAGETLCQYLNTGVIALEELPADVQDLIDVYVTAEKTIKYTLNKDAYKVGRGRNTLRGPTDYGRKHYVHKHDLTQGNEAYRHDVSGILEVDKLLRATNKSIREFRAEKKRVARTADEKMESLERRNATLEQKNRTLKEQVKTLKENSNDARITEIRTTSKKKRRISDTPNVFNIISAVDMPYQLRKIFDVSFTEMADTKVQFASRDENGQLYNKEDFNEKGFNSRLKHEVNNWDTFYEANRDTLLSLTRNDVLDILEFLKGGVRTLDGPANKLAAFEIFILGYIVDGARRNAFDWNFSIKEIEIIEKLYEQRASEHGSGLNAVQQMLKVIDPLKKVRQRMFDDWDVVSDTDKDNLIKAVDDLQNEKDPKKQKDMAQKIIETLREFEKRQIESDKTKYPRWSKAWWARQWSKIKSWRYMAMLSSPTTWVRNIISNVLMGHFNKISDMLGSMVFKTLGKGEYRKEQWDLSKTKISAEAKNFIDVYILNNPIFDPTKEDIKNGAVSLYDLSGKYDPRQNKKIQENRELLINLIANAYENKYAQDRRFDRKTLNYIAKFVDQRISDKWFVRRVASRYFGKILTIEAQRGKVDLSQGLSAQALDLFAEAVLMANQEYMHKRSAVADMIDNLRDKHPVLHEVLTFWQPFINSSVNWFAETFKYTPIGLANSIKRMCQLEKQITRLDERRANSELVLDSRTAQFLARRDIGKGVLGMILSGLGVMLACSGRLRIDEDDDKFYAYIDEQIKLDISALFASSSIFVGASIAQKWIEQSDGDVATWEEVFSMLTDTMLDGFFAIDLLERHKWGTTWDSILTETESVMRSFVPQAWQTIIACTNHYNIRYSRGFKGMWERWLNTFVPTQPLGNRKINPYTGELEDKYSLPILGGLLQKGILGPKVYWVEVSETERMCRELGVNKNELTGELTVNEQKYKLDTIALNTKYGELNKESLAKIKSQRHKVEMPNGTYQTLPWDKMSDKQRANVIERTFTHNANIAKIYMWTQMGHKYYASASTWAELRKLGITQNVYTGDKGFVE